MNSTLLILAVCRTRVTYQPSKWPSSPRGPRSSVGESAQPVSGRPWVRFPSGKQNFSLSHSRVYAEKYIFTFYHRAQNLLSLLFTTHLMNSTLLILAVCRTRVTYQPGKWPSSPRVSRCWVGYSAQRPVSGRPWVRFPSGTQNLIIRIRFYLPLQKWFFTVKLQWMLKNVQSKKKSF